MRTPAAIALTVAMTCASIQSSAATPEPATADAGTFTIEVIVREDVPEGSAPSFEVVEANLADYSQLAEVQRQLAESLLKKDEGEQHSLRQARPLPRPLPRLLPRPLPCPRAAPAPRVL